MFLIMNLGGVTIRFSVRKYFPWIKKEDDGWCKIDYECYSPNMIHYAKINAELLEIGEVNQIVEKLEDLLEGRLVEKEVLAFIEPDFTFVLYPKKTIDAFLDWKVMLWGDFGEATDNYFSISLYRKDIMNLLNYIKLAGGTMDEDDPVVQKMVKEGILSLDEWEKK